jgi:hypothetical protein
MGRVATVVAVMDRGEWGANTDNIVVVDPGRRRLLWVPRDLWCQGIQRRINRAFAHGGHAGLIEALAEHGIEAHHVICLRREATEQALEGVTVTVPVRRRMEFLYPLDQRRTTQEASKLVLFEPPREALSGERIHHWLGARYSPGGGSTDLDRIERQKTFIWALLRGGFDFRRLLAAGPELVSVSTAAAVEEVGRVDLSWRLKTLAAVLPVTIDGMQVLRLETALRARMALRIKRRVSGDLLASDWSAAFDKFGLGSRQGF